MIVPFKYLISFFVLTAFVFPDWSLSDKKVFISSCVLEELKSEVVDYDFGIGYCVCTQKELENLYSVDDLVSAPESSFDSISEKCMNEYFSFVPEWNDVAVTQFLYGCLEDISSKGYSVEVASSYCGCTLALLKANYTFDDIDMQKIHNDDLIEISNYCETTFLVPNPISGSLSQDEVDIFMSSCIETESQALGIENASIFCECLLDKTIELDSRNINKETITKVRNKCALDLINAE